MPQYTVVAQIQHKAPVKYRAARADKSIDTRIMNIEARNLIETVQKAQQQHNNTVLRIISAEERYHPSAALDDQQLTAVLLDPKYSTLDPHDPLYDDPEYTSDSPGLYYEEGFSWYIEAISTALRNADITPGLSVDIHHSDDGEESASVSVYDLATNTYRMHFTSTKTIAGNPSLLGWNAILAVARQLIDIAHRLS